jgi:hypothetical protein
MQLLTIDEIIIILEIARVSLDLDDQRQYLAEELDLSDEVIVAVRTKLDAYLNGEAS